MSFLDENYLLNSDEAKKIYACIAALPVIDVHNHADVKRIADNTPFTDLWEMFAATDHYMWEMMRKCGVAEKYITGNASNQEKWGEFARVTPLFAGNPAYEWIHMDLAFLGLGGKLLSAETAGEFWNDGLAVLAKEENLPQNLIRRMNIQVMCSTDDAADMLEEHARANAAFGRPVIRPTWRPDRVMKIRKDDFAAYIEKLGASRGMKIGNLADLKLALKKSHDYFAERGAIASDHGIEKPLGTAPSAERAQEIFHVALKGGKVSEADEEVWSAYLMNYFGELDAETGWVFQIHMGAVRDVHDRIYAVLGPDAGGDVSDHSIEIVKPLCRFLNRFDNRLKTVLYCLDPWHQADLATVARAFSANCRLGSAWWFNDTPVGMQRQLEYIASVDLLSAFAGMVSDSRKILSYSSRFQMFRRVLANVLGAMVQQGRVPQKVAEDLAVIMCQSGPEDFFNLK